MIREYVLVSPAGEILDQRELDDADVIAPEDLVAHKPRYLPLERQDPAAYDAATQVLEGPALAVQADRVVSAYTVRAKTVGEIEAMRTEKLAGLSAAFDTRTLAPIGYTVGGVAKTWDADAEARSRILGVLQLMAAGVLPTERTWMAYGELGPTSVAQGDLAGIAGAIATREDALFVVKKTREALLRGLETAAEVAAFDPDAGWPA